MDVAVKPGAVFDTDHRLIKLKLRIPPMAYWPRGQSDRGVSCRRGRPANLNVHLLKQPEIAGRFNAKLTDLAEDMLLDEYELWARAVRLVAEDVLGTVQLVSRPQWQVENEAELSGTHPALPATWEAKGRGREIAAHQVCAEEQMAGIL